MHPCPEPSCEYRTSNPKNLRKHIEKTRHGQAVSAKEFKGHRHTPRKRKKRK